ncbi:hypothetical protein OIU76_010502 [Salix suchowensis]|uniref:Cysteine-rich transmembrane domain-containing protein n=3 Tax=Salix TaxID=40685 RepID=A0A9Q0VF30_9ROSI|nr:hypothetical protein IMY05_006G0031300 [Salix suchowensis]KAJ6408328.1 hypothetical protein OIU84_011609 [Salix udensis]KAJ6747574.1 hypothetical protein OIU74_029934 [Salix koriyanagi]KAJ6332126.1 hypothetical protein OIU76_010502 [Salix suchowensis]KAJ6363512.1 hypothetical protein OIU78_003645 [Salix suchowensis]
MPALETRENKPPEGSIETPTTGMKCFPRTKKKGERGFIEGCLFALCCCWVCEMCF